MTDIRPTATTAAPGAPAPPVVRRRPEALHFALRNRKAVGGLAVILLSLLLGVVGPFLTDYGPRQRNAGPPFLPPSGDHWLGTTYFGQDVFTQLGHGIRATFLVAVLAAALAAAIGMSIGFAAGYRGGVLDELLMMLTNIVLVLPVFVVLIALTAYVGVNSHLTQALVIGMFAWPWVARAVRAQTLSLRSRDYVDLARLTGMRPFAIVYKDIAPNMASYLVMAFIVLFGGAVLFAAALDFLGLGPRDTVSLGYMLQIASQWSATSLGMWWWFVPPGAAIVAITGAAYLTNVGLDEVFNPKLRDR